MESKYNEKTEDNIRRNSSSLGTTKENNTVIEMPLSISSSITEDKSILKSYCTDDCTVSQIHVSDILRNLSKENPFTRPNLKLDTLLKSILMFCLTILPFLLLFTFFINVTIIQLLYLVWPETWEEVLPQKIVACSLIALTNSIYIYYEIMHCISDLTSWTKKVLAIIIRVIISIIALVLFNCAVSKYYDCSISLFSSIEFVVILLFLNMGMLIRTVPDVLITYMMRPNGVVGLAHELLTGKYTIVQKSLFNLTIALLLVFCVLMTSMTALVSDNFSNNIDNLVEVLKTVPQEILNI